MIDTRVELICELIIKGIPLTRTNLINNGIQESEINKILEEGILKPINNE